jgi:sugar transferase EpsL
MGESAGSSVYPTVKRVMDLMLASVGMLLLCPVVAVVALIILLTLGRPVVFHQDRVGLNGRIFELFKFRTMSNETDDEGNLLPDRERHTCLGRFLRRASLDELPQLWNVLRGDMSIVGPRPLLVEYLPYYSKREARRHSVRPGITGLAQVSGRNLLSWDERLLKDVDYVQSQSLRLDLWILLRTLWKVFRQQEVVEPVGPEDKLSDARRPKETPSGDAEDP